MNQTIKEISFQSGKNLQIAQGDITAEEVDAIVNAANSHLMHGMGVAGAISRRGGPVVQAQSNQWIREHGPVIHSEPAITSAGNLPCRYIIHAVGPVWGEGAEEEKLRSTILGSLRRAEQLQLTSIAFPAISTGIFGFPKERAAKVIMSAILDYFTEATNSNLRLVRLVLFDGETLQEFLEAWEQDDHFNP